MKLDGVKTRCAGCGKRMWAAGNQDKSKLKAAIIMCGNCMRKGRRPS